MQSKHVQGKMYVTITFQYKYKISRTTKESDIILTLYKIL